MHEHTYIFDNGNSRVVQEQIRTYVHTHFREIKSKDPGAGDSAIDYAISVTREALERESADEHTINTQCEDLAVAMLQYELFNRFIGEV